MGKRIGVFCDGTWNTAAQRYSTNVRLLCESAGQHPSVQHLHYFDGVGAGEERLLGGLFGVGLDRILLEAYVRLCIDYRQGDEIFLFGFSRGAYMARSLVGLMRKCGVLGPENAEKAQQALALYRRRERGPDSPAALAFRKQYAAAYYEPYGCSDNARRGGLMITYLGLWETIGALGVPQRVPFSEWFNRRYRFHDCDISTIVKRARHCLAVDEFRRALPATPWSDESIARVNAVHGARRIEQAWFPGDHGAVGGGGMRAELSSGPLLWVAEGARKAGFEFDDRKGHLERAARISDPVNGMLRNADGDDFWLGVQGHGQRVHGAPRTLDNVSEELARRAGSRANYLSEVSRRGRWRRELLKAVLPKLSTPQRLRGSAGGKPSPAPSLAAAAAK
jgi:uncharacterized protein (DUF2235 family)